MDEAGGGDGGSGDDGSSDNAAGAAGAADVDNGDNVMAGGCFEYVMMVMVEVTFMI